MDKDKLQEAEDKLNVLIDEGVKDPEIMEDKVFNKLLQARDTIKHLRLNL